MPLHKKTEHDSPRSNHYHEHRSNQKYQYAGKKFSRSKAIEALHIAENILYSYMSICDEDDPECRDTKKAIKGLREIEQYLKVQKGKV